MSLPTIAEFRTYLGFDADSTIDTALLQLSLDASLEAITLALNRNNLQPATAASARVYIPADSWTVEVDEFSEVAALVVKTDTALDGTFATTISSTLYQPEPLNALLYGLAYTRIRLLGSIWPFSSIGRPTVQVTAKWGYPSLPSALKMGILLQASRWYQRKNSPEGVLGSNDFGTVRVNRVDPDVIDMIRRYKKHVVS